MELAAPLIGRAGPLAAVADALRADRPVAIVGEAGIGKTSIVRAAAARAGRQLHEGGGFATLSWLPYLALRRAIPLTEAADPAQVAAAARHAIGDGILFIDDLQWADESTRAVVDLLLGTMGVAVAVREGEPDAGATVESVRELGALVVRLPALDSRAAMALATRLMPDSPDSDRRGVTLAAGGNPLLIEELAAHGEAPSWLTRALLRQLDSLSAAQRRALEVLAAAGRPMPLETLGRAGALLLDRGLLEARPGGMMIRHRLIIDALHGANGISESVRPPRGRRTDALDRRVAALAAGIAAGQLAEVAEEAAALLSEPLAAAARQRVLASRGLALGLLGRAEEAEPALNEAAGLAIAVTGGDASVRSSWAEASFWGGLPRRALDQAESALRTASSDADQMLPSITRAWALVELGRRPSPIPHLEPAWSPGALPELRGLAALGEDEPVTAAAAFQTASRLWAGRDLPRELICRWAAGEARRRAGDRDAAAGLRTTLAAASAIGFEPLAARIRRSLRLAGDHPTPLRADRIAGDPLTARERQVLELVERGRTNPEIARRMGLGRPTVARILLNAMTRLGAQSRAHAVVLAAGDAGARASAEEAPTL